MRLREKLHWTPTALLLHLLIGFFAAGNIVVLTISGHIAAIRTKHTLESSHVQARLVSWDPP
jgi:hypothetical protein